jgi:hypothetical protein
MEPCGMGRSEALSTEIDGSIAEYLVDRSKGSGKVTGHRFRRFDFFQFQFVWIIK